MPVKDEKSIRKKLSPEAKSATTWSRDVPEARALPAASFTDHSFAPPSAER